MYVVTQTCSDRPICLVGTHEKKLQQENRLCPTNGAGNAVAPSRPASSADIGSLVEHLSPASRS